MAELTLDPGRGARQTLEPAAPPVIAATLAVVAWFAHWRGADLPAALYRISLFHRHGLTLWDSQWYGGHWTLDYSVIFPPVAGILGLVATEIACVAVAAWAFDRLVVGHFGRSARVGSVAFALGTLVQVAIGQLPFLMGESLGLAALWAVSRRHWRVAVVLAMGAALASPLAGAFVALAAAAWLLADWPRYRAHLVVLIGSVALPVLTLSLLFPGQGAMPFPFKDWLFELIVYSTAAALVPRKERALRIGILLYLVVFFLCFFLHSPVGGNIERLGEAFGPAVLLVVVWPHRHLLVGAWFKPVTFITVAVAALLIVLQWGPALGALSTNRVDPSSKVGYFTPLVGYLAGHQDPLARVEIVPTLLHWEAAYAAPVVELARGWERQLDTADNPIFYTPGALTVDAYRAWLLNNGVRYVALADARLDYAGKAEGRLVGAGIPGLDLVWRDAHWRVYAVQGAGGIVTGPAIPVHLDGGRIDLQVTQPGTVLVRVRYNSRWSVAEGAACIAPDPGGWMRVEASAAGPLRLELSLVGSSGHSC